MLTGALQHIRGVGPVKLAQLADIGIHTWHDVQAMADTIPRALKKHVLEETERCLQAMAGDDIEYFVDTLYGQDRWRILHHYLDRLSYFDIETTGLEYDDVITLIVCWHKGQLHTFVEHENLDDFLDLLDDIELLVSFNGSTFDVPRVLDGFHIPQLPCPHLDLRWPCYYADLHGGLKQITATLGLQRPIDLHDADGQLAVELWSRWLHSKDPEARELLIRYCAADVLLMVPLTQNLAGESMVAAEDLWQFLPAARISPQQASPREHRLTELENKFGPASPSKLRTRRP